MRTAVISDLHLGLLSGGDILHDAETRTLLLEEIGDADRVVLLGDVVELREQPLGRVLEAARPFFEALGAALGEREVTIVPGNHDHRFAEPLLDDLSLADSELGLEQTHDPSPGPTELIDSWLGPARLRIGYPGLWLREDVYATHGHYMDAHLNLPRAECLAIATLLRLSRQLPETAAPGDYERVVRPLYGFFFGAAQARRRRKPTRNQAAAAEAAWEVLAGEKRGDRTAAKLRIAAARAGFPLGVKGVNRLLHSEFDADVSARAIFAGGVAAGAELANRLGLGDAHVITGHTHRGGPTDSEAEWELAGGGRLHNTGSWVFSSLFHHPGTPPNAYWPGTVTWVEDEGAPRRVQLLLERSHAEMNALLGH
jgi:hypothetical protein